MFLVKIGDTVQLCNSKNETLELIKNKSNVKVFHAKEVNLTQNISYDFEIDDEFIIGEFYDKFNGIYIGKIKDNYYFAFNLAFSERYFREIQDLFENEFNVPYIGEFVVPNKNEMLLLYNNRKRISIRTPTPYYSYDLHSYWLSEYDHELEGNAAFNFRDGTILHYSENCKNNLLLFNKVNSSKIGLDIQSILW